MASASDIVEVRGNTNEPTDEHFTDEVVSAWVDSNGVAGTSAIIWRKKAARYADQVNTSEAGASRALSDLNKHAIAMAATWDGVKAAETTGTPEGKPRAKIHKIVRQ